MNATKVPYFISLFAAFFVHGAMAQVDLHTSAIPVRPAVDVSISENFAPFGHRPDTDKAGDDGSVCFRDRNGVLIWVTRDGLVNLVPQSTLAKTIYVSNTECIVYENRFQSIPPIYESPDYDSVIAIHRLDGEGKLSTRRATFPDQTIMDSIPITPTTYGYTIVTASYVDDGFTESFASGATGPPVAVNAWAVATYTLYRLTWTATNSATELDVQYLKNMVLDVPRTGNAIADTAVIGYGDDGSILFNRSIAANYSIYVPAGGYFRSYVASFMITCNIDAESFTQMSGYLVPPFKNIVSIDNERLLVENPIPLLIGFDTNGLPLYQESGTSNIDDYRTRRSNGLTSLNSTYTLDNGETVLPVGSYSRRGFPKYFHTLQNNNTEIRLNIIRSGLERLGASIIMPSTVLPDSPSVRNTRDGSLMVRSEGETGILWFPTTVDADGLATGIESMRIVPDSEGAQPLHVNSDEGVVWMNSNDPVDISFGAEIPPAVTRHVSKQGAAGVNMFPLNIEGRYVATPPRISNDASSEGWFVNTFEKLRSNNRTARIRTYRLYYSSVADADGDGISDFEERFVYFTDPENPDTDLDGVTDGQEVRPFQLILGSFTWEDARKDANSQGGRLAVLDTTAKQIGLDYILGRSIRALSDTTWIGGNDIEVEGQYRWVTKKGGRNGALLPANPDNPSNNWDRPFHPNNLFDSDAMGIVSNKQLNWRMFPVTQQFPYIIEFIGSDPLNKDTDGDGLTDGEEREIGSDPTERDTDGDGLTDKEEYDMGTDPKLVDTDGDGLSDFDEVRKYRTDPLKEDTDGDGLDDGSEISRGTDPRKRDTDGDGLFDGDEVRIGTDPLDTDTDNDGLTDGREVDLGTDPLSRDSDGDGLKDGEEVTNGTDPLDSRDPKRLDSDNDGLTDYEEIFIYRTNPDKKDTDGEGLNDKDEVKVYGTNPLRKDTDQDGISDYDEIFVTFSDPNKPSTGSDPIGGNIPFGTSTVQGVYEGMVISAKGGQTFKQTIRISGGGGFTTKLFGLRSNTSFKGKFSNNGVYIGKPPLTEDLKSVRLQVVRLSNSTYSVQGSYESRSGGKYYVEMHKVNQGAKSAATRKVTLDTKHLSGKGPKGSVVGLGKLTEKTSINLNFYLPDGTRSSFSSPILKGNRIALYARSTDPSDAVLMGVLKLKNLEGKSDFNGLVRFFSSQNRVGSFYPSGYDQQLEIRGAYYRNPAAGELPVEGFKVASNNAAYQWKGGDFDGIKKSGTWTTDGNMVIPTNQNDSVRVSFEKSTGLLKMTYKRTDDGRDLVDATSHVVAVAQQKADTFRGYYISDGSAASFNVVPNKGIVDPDYTSISPRSKSISAAGGTYTVTVKTEGEWTVELPSTGLVDANNIRVTAIIKSGGGTGTPEEVKGNGNGTVTFTVEPNVIYSRLKATIKIAGINHELTQEFR